MSQGKLIGRISACIAGDSRYTSVVTVHHCDTDGEGIHSYRVARSENGAAGGMDGPGGSLGFREVVSTILYGPTPRELLEGIKRLFDHTLVTYGKPTKNFSWHTRETGLSQAKAVKAMEEVK